jgi:hypothetical protein
LSLLRSPQCRYGCPPKCRDATTDPVMRISSARPGQQCGLRGYGPCRAVTRLSRTTELQGTRRGEWLQVRLGGEPGERAAAGVGGEQCDWDAEWRLPAPVGFDVREEIVAPRPVEVLAGPAEGVLQSVGVPPTGCLRGHRGAEQFAVGSRRLRPGPASGVRDDPAGQQVAAGIMGQQLQLVPCMEGDEVTCAPRRGQQFAQPRGGEDTLGERLPQEVIVEAALLLHGQQRERRYQPLREEARPRWSAGCPPSP